MLPGGLGTFDGTMIIGLGLLGVSPTLATVWVLLYRIFYYFLPFAVGVFLFAQELLARVNHFLDDIPMSIVQRSAQIIITIFMYFSGIMMILLATVPNVVLTNRLYLSLAPYTLYFLGQLSNVVIGCLLVGLARGVGSQVKKSLLANGCATSLCDWKYFMEGRFPQGSSNFLVCDYGLFVVCPERNVSRAPHLFVGALLTDAGIFIATFVIYVLVGLLMGNGRSVIKLTNAYLLPSQQVWIIGLIGFVIAICILYGLYRYLSYSSPSKTAWLYQKFDAERVRTVINNFGGNEDSHLAFLRDKKLYFYQEDHQDQMVFMYRQKANKLIVMGEPFGNQEKLEAAIDQFMLDADNVDLTLVFYEVSESLTMLLHDKGFDFIKAGEEGYVNLKDFTLVGKRHRGERALMHKFSRDGYHFDILQPPFSENTLAKLRLISEEWLEGREEKGFSLGFFDDYYLNQAPIAVIHDQDDEIVAFANLMPTGDHQTTSIDLMRSGGTAPSGIMDAIFINLFNYSKEVGYQWFNLGMAPLANVGNSRFSFINEKNRAFNL